VSAAGGVRNSDGDGGGGYARLLRGGGLGSLRDRGLRDWVLGNRGLGGSYRVLRVGGLGGDMLNGLGGSNWVAGVLSRLGGSMLGNRGLRGSDRVAGVLGRLGGSVLGNRGVGRVGGSRSRGGNGCGTVLGNGGSDAGESSEGGNGVTHFG
jgi:hypothetical protein